MCTIEAALLTEGEGAVELSRVNVKCRGIFAKILNYRQRLMELIGVA